MYQYGQIVMLLVISTFGLAEISEHRNTKRLIWGSPLSSTNAYSVTGYHAFLTKGNRYSYIVSKIVDLFTGELPNPTINSLKCGGALITSNVIQTACHCYCRFKKVNASYHQAHAVNGWESWSPAYVGYTVINQMIEDGLSSKKFIVHEKCALLMNSVGAESITHDYGLVVLNKDVNFRRLSQSLAPLYSAEALSMIYYQISKRESVCLHIGFGAYYFKKPGVRGKASPVLQHGWRVNRSYWYCYWRIYIFQYRNYMHDFGLSYPQLATWICSQFFGKERGASMPGDSGSPVTCHNEYVGLTSFKHVLYSATNVSTDFYSSLAFAQFENAADYRRSLIAKISDYFKLREWPPDEPVHIEARNDWGPYFLPGSPNTNIWILKRFDDQLDISMSTGRISRCDFVVSVSCTLLLVEAK